MRAASVLLVAVLTAPLALSQYDPIVRDEGERFTLRGPSADHSIHVVFPPGYDPDRADPYPVLYYGDAWWLDGIVNGTARIAAMSREDRLEPVVLVGIGVVGNKDDWDKQRNRDFTPSPIRLQPGLIMYMPGSNIPVDSASTGGAAAFLAFLREDLAPRIEADYHVDPDRRGWLGHSFGGLFGAWAHTQDPGFFEDLVLISPSVFWNDREVMDAPLASDATVFVAYGTSEFGAIAGNAPLLAEYLEAAGASVELRPYEGRDHQSLLGPAIWDGLVRVYGR